MKPEVIEQNNRHIHSAEAFHSQEYDEEVMEVEIGTEAEKARLLHELTEAKAIRDRVELFSRVMDEYGLDAIMGMIPVLGDGAVGVVSSLYLLYEGRKLGFGRKETLKILGYQFADMLIGSTSVPIISDMADYLFRANRNSYQMFEEKVQQLETYAKNHGATQEEIDALSSDRNRLREVLKQIIPKK